LAAVPTDGVAQRLTALLAHKLHQLGQADGQADEGDARTHWAEALGLLLGLLQAAPAAILRDETGLRALMDGLQSQCARDAQRRSSLCGDHNIAQEVRVRPALPDAPQMSRAPRCRLVSGAARGVVRVACGMLLVARCMLCVARCMLCVARCMLCVARCMLCVARCMLCVARCMLCVARCMLRAARSTLCAAASQGDAGRLLLPGHDRMGAAPSARSQRVHYMAPRRTRPDSVAPVAGRAVPA
jgi:hypothetical protein